ncbi:MAG: Cd(II)/Pb(II)-responsive transcriptional regulator [Betaproteobacteria bacterium]|nr:Cd(II)/Pb(II)-responsive transcriptional regulator [Betaproteobacteria bacterium]
MRIGELGKATGVDRETIRYYERTGMLPAAARLANGYRAYGAVHLERLAFIRHCRALDMPLVDVRLLLDFLDRPRNDCADVNRLIDAQLVRVRARLKSMRALGRQLEQLRGRCNAKHATTDCGILHELVAAAQGEARTCHGDAATAPIGMKGARKTR